MISVYGLIVVSARCGLDLNLRVDRCIGPLWPGAVVGVLVGVLMGVVVGVVLVGVVVGVVSVDLMVGVVVGMVVSVGVVVSVELWLLCGTRRRCCTRRHARGRCRGR